MSRRDRIDQLRAQPDRRLIAASVVVFLGRAAFAWGKISVSLSPDEYANVGMARYLSGGRWSMLDASTWRPGFSVVLVPLFWLFEDPETRIRAALLLNAAIGAACLPLSYMLVRRLTELPSRWALILATWVGLLPSALSASAHAWAEPLVTLTFLATLVLLLYCFDGRGWAYGLGAVVVAVGGYTSHGRLLPLVVVSVGILVARAARSRQWGAATAVLAAGLIGILISNLFASWVVARVWESPSDLNTVGGTLSRLSDPLAVVEAGLGQLWYLMVSSGLLFGLGVVEMLRRMSRRTSDIAARRDAWVVFAVSVPLVATSMLFMSDRPRPDHLIYGRYNDAVSWPILMLGVAWLVETAPRLSARRRLTALGVLLLLTLEFGLLIRQLHGATFDSSLGVAQMISGALPLVFGSGLPILQVTALCAVLSLVLLGLAEMATVRPALVVVTFTMLLVAAGWRLNGQLELSSNVYAASASVTDLADGPLEGEQEVGFSLMPNAFGPLEPGNRQIALALTYQWYLPGVRLVLDQGEEPYLFAVRNNDLLDRQGAEIVWSDQVSGMALWRRR